MKVFMTGASGFIGSHVTPLLREAGHEVTALVRSDKGVTELQAQGVTVVKGDLESYELIGEEAGKADAVVSPLPRAAKTSSVQSAQFCFTSWVQKELTSLGVQFVSGTTSLPS